VKTVRFTKVVEKSGEPEPHLVLTAPDQDPVLRNGIKEHRVMTVHQESVGHKADRGAVGFDPGINRQFLVFPKSLRTFEGKEVVGIKYDLIKAKDVPKAQRAARPKLPQPKKHQPGRPKAAPRHEPAKERAKEQETELSVAEIKRRVRRAMNALEEGKAVAAFNLLKEIVEE